MRQSDRDWLEDWFDHLQLRIVILDLQVQEVLSNQQALKQTLAALRRDPKLSAEQILAVWQSAAVLAGEERQEKWLALVADAQAEQRRCPKKK